MDAESPIVRSVAWLYTIPQLLLMLGLGLVFWKLRLAREFGQGLLYSAIVYLIYSFGSKTILLKHHKSGISFLKLNQFREAISAFQSSYSFLAKYSWIDKYRFLTMLDSSAVPYREMALCNIAFAHVQLEETEEAQEHYKRTLAEFPESIMAKSSLDHLESGKRR